MAAAARKAWNEAMKATAGATALPPAFQQPQRKRRSDRNKKQERRTKARKVQKLGDDPESDEYRTALWIDALEGVDPSTAAADDDEEYDELDDYEEGRSKKKQRKRRRGNVPKAGVLPKRFLPRTLGSILVEEVSYGPEYSVAKAFLKAHAKVPPQEQLPRRKFCPVTGQFGRYVEPKSGIPYTNLRALEQIQERPPPWMTLGGSAAFLEASKSILDEE